MQVRRSVEFRRASIGSQSFPRFSSDRDRLMQSYDVEEAQRSFALGDLAEDSEEEVDTSKKRTSFDNGNVLESNGGVAGLSPVRKVTA